MFVTESPHKFPSSEEVPALMRKFTEQVPLWKELYHPVEYTARLHRHLAGIHPFIDGNSRVSRPLMNPAPSQSEHTITVIFPVLRSEYIETLKSSYRHIRPFILFICRCQIDSPKKYLQLLKNPFPSSAVHDSPDKLITHQPIQVFHVWPPSVKEFKGKKLYKKRKCF